MQLTRASASRPIAVITGYTGFLGTRIAKYLLQRGWAVRGMARAATQNDEPRIERHNFELGDVPNAAAMDGAAVLVHCAHAVARDSRESKRLNVDGSAKLFAATRQAGVPKIVYISSFAAGQHAHSEYGREKAEVEALLDPSNDLCLRPGLIAGDGSLYRALYETIQRFHIAPVFSGARQPVYMIRDAELCAAIELLIEKDAHGLHYLASPAPIALAALYRLLARKAATHVRLIPLPFNLTVGTIAALERCGVRLPVSSDSLRGLLNMTLIDFPSYDGLRFAAPEQTIMDTQLS